MVDAQPARAWLESTKSKGMALGLDNTAKAIAALELPSPTYETVHVAGSNGKGTTIATLGAALTAAGLPHIAFTSPHLVRVEERVRLNGTPIASATFDEALASVHAMATRTDIALTFFETTLLVALVVAADQQPEVMLLETGLGGRLDATRAVPADVAVITSLSLEHTDLLGDTLEAIAGEKAAIARPGKPLIVRAVTTQRPALKSRTSPTTPATEPSTARKALQPCTGWRYPMRRRTSMKPTCWLQQRGSTSNARMLMDGMKSADYGGQAACRRFTAKVRGTSGSGGRPQPQRDGGVLQGTVG